MSTTLDTYTPERLAALSASLEGKSAPDILRWAFDEFGDRITLACSFGGPSGMVLLDMATKIRPNLRVFYIDTEVLFPETYELAEQAAKRYGIEPLAFRPLLTIDQQAAEHGDALWSRDPDACCAIRKVEPNRRALKGMDAWISGLRRDQGGTRADTPVVGPDTKFGVVKVNPLVQWTEKDVWRYIVENNVPYNPLHDRGYPSIGCTHCTRPAGDGEDSRAGRWEGFDKTECGLHG